MVAGWLTRSSACLDWAAKPVMVTVMVNRPGAICGNSYAPFESVLVVAWKPVALFLSSAWAPGTRAPAGSVTVPRREVSPVCAGTQSAKPRIRADAKNTFQCLM